MARHHRRASTGSPRPRQCGDTSSKEEGVRGGSRHLASEGHAPGSAQRQLSTGTLIPSHLEAGARLAFKVDSGPSSEKEKVDV